MSFNQSNKELSGLSMLVGMTQLLLLVVSQELLNYTANKKLSLIQAFTLKIWQRSYTTKNQSQKTKKILKHLKKIKVV